MVDYRRALLVACVMVAATTVVPAPSTSLVAAQEPGSGAQEESNELRILGMRELPRDAAMADPPSRSSTPVAELAEETADKWQSRGADIDPEDVHVYEIETETGVRYLLSSSHRSTDNVALYEGGSIRVDHAALSLSDLQSSGQAETQQQPEWDPEPLECDTYVDPEDASRAAELCHRWLILRNDGDPGYVHLGQWYSVTGQDPDGGDLPIPILPGSWQGGGQDVSMWVWADQASNGLFPYTAWEDWDPPSGSIDRQNCTDGASVSITAFDVAEFSQSARWCEKIIASRAFSDAPGGYFMKWTGKTSEQRELVFMTYGRQNLELAELCAQFGTCSSVTWGVGGFVDYLIDVGLGGPSWWQ